VRGLRSLNFWLSIQTWFIRIQVYFSRVRFFFQKIFYKLREIITETFDDIVAGAKWYKVPGIWWNTVERLSWTMVGKPAAYGCKFRAVKENE